MKKLCIGTFLTILSQAQVTSRVQGRLFATILNVIEETDTHCDTAFQGHLKSGNSNLSPAYIALTIQKPVEEIAGYFTSDVFPLLNTSLHKHIILAFREVLKEDTAILETANLCAMPGYTKHDILTKNTFSLAGLLACLFKYSVTAVVNSNCKAGIKEIPKDFLSTFDNRINEIQINECSTVPETPLALTARSVNFDTVFTEVEHYQTLTIPNPSAVHIYHLDITNNEFGFEEIAKFIKSNIGRYVFSRAKRNEYTGDSIEDITHDAIVAYKKRVTLAPNESHFAEIMLYSFLECALNAPKISSKIELQSIGGTYQSKTSGIHLLPGGVNNQIVFGASEVINDLQLAIDSAFAQIDAIKSTSRDEYTLVESTVLSNSFDASTTAYLKNLLIPQKGGSIKPDSAFGLFLGYSIEIPNAETLSNAEYRDAVNKKMQADITTCIPHIQDLIKNFNLTSYSFYIYVLPLNDANRDKTDIMEIALGGNL